MQMYPFRVKPALAALLCVLGVANPVVADPPSPYSVTVDVFNARAPNLNTYQANDRTWRVTFQENGETLNLTGSTNSMSWFTSAHASSVVYAASNVVNAANGIVDFSFTAANLNTNGTFYYEMAIENSNRYMTAKQGKLKIRPSPPAAGVSAATFASAINFDNYLESGTISNVTLVGDGSSITGIDHGAGMVAASLLDDDHTQYGKLDEAETISGDWTFTGNAVNTANPWADNEVADSLTVSEAGIAAAITRDSEWDTFTELQTAVSDKTLVNVEDAATISGDWVNTSNPWADNEVANDLTVDESGIASAITRDSEWDTFAELQTAVSDKTLINEEDSMVLDGNVRIGNGTPALATAVEALYVEGITEVDAAIYADGGLFVDVISEDPSLSRGVTIDGVLLKDAEVSADKINEDTVLARGVTIDGAVIMDGEFKSAYVDRFHATYTNTVTINNATFTLLPFDVEAVGDDPDGVFTLATSTITWNGKGMCHVDLYWDVNANNHAYHYASMYKNGSAEFRFNQEQIGNGNPWPGATGPIFFYNDHATNQWQVWFYINDGANPVSSANTPHRHWISGYRLPE